MMNFFFPSTAQLRINILNVHENLAIFYTQLSNSSRIMFMDESLHLHGSDSLPLARSEKIQSITLIFANI